MAGSYDRGRLVEAEAQIEFIQFISRCTTLSEPIGSR